MGGYSNSSYSVAGQRRRHEAADERLAILRRDGYRCTTVVEDRLHGGRHRCTTMGSEITVRDGRAMCPRHAREHDEAEV